MPGQEQVPKCPFEHDVPLVGTTGTSKIPFVRAAQDVHATIADPVTMLEECGDKYAGAFRVRVPLGPKLTYFTKYKTFRNVVRLAPGQAGMGGVLAQIPAISKWFSDTVRDEGTLESLAVETRSIIRHLVAPIRLREAEFPRLVRELTASGAGGWDQTADLSTDLHPIVYQAALRFLLGDELWTEFGVELVRSYHLVVDSADVKRLALARAPMRYLMPEYWATRRLGKLLPLFFEPGLAGTSPAIMEINRRAAGNPAISADDRVWILMFLIWNAVSYSGSYTIWTLVDVLSDSALHKRLETSTGPKREDLLSRCLWETIRRHPLAVMTRKVKEPLVCLDGGRTYQIPAGEYVGAVITPLTRDEQRFPNAERYHPDRYLDAPPPLDLLFGRGAFGCVAQEFSRIIVSSVLSELFERFHLGLAGPVPERVLRVHLTYPTRPILISLRRRQPVPPRRQTTGMAGPREPMA